MTPTRSFLIAIAGTVASLAMPFAAMPAQAAVDPSDPQRLIQTLTGEGFAAMKTGDKTTAKQQFRALLANHVAVDQIGDRLVRRWLPTITPAQKAAYRQALPTYIVGTYADRLFDYASATVKVLRAQPVGGGVDVMTQVIRPGSQPMPAVFSVVQVNGAWKVANLRVAGINVAMAQAADFDSVVQREGFDALIRRMKARG